jgi:hypothetical protein
VQSARPAERPESSLTSNTLFSDDVKSFGTARRRGARQTKLPVLDAWPQGRAMETGRQAKMYAPQGTRSEARRTSKLQGSLARGRLAQCAAEDQLAVAPGSGARLFGTGRATSVARLQRTDGLCAASLWLAHWMARWMDWMWTAGTRGPPPRGWHRRPSTHADLHGTSGELTSGPRPRGKAAATTPPSPRGPSASADGPGRRRNPCPGIRQRLAYPVEKPVEKYADGSRPRRCSSRPAEVPACLDFFGRSRNLLYTAAIVERARKPKGASSRTSGQTGRRQRIHPRNHEFMPEGLEVGGAACGNVGVGGDVATDRKAGTTAAQRRGGRGRGDSDTRCG